MREQELLTPVYLVDEGKIIQNLKILQEVEKDTGGKILLAQKAFSLYKLYPLIGQYLAGATASGLYEARLAHEEMQSACSQTENHVFCPAYTPAEMEELCQICDHIIFNGVFRWHFHFGGFVIF